MSAVTVHQADNAPRFQAGTEHVESWFFRANHPTEPRAIWLKATILSRRGGAVAEAWCSLFDGDRDRALGRKVTVPMASARIGGSSLGIHVEGCSFQLGADRGSAKGTLGEFSWDLSWERLPGPLGEPLCMLPSRRLVDARLPRNKLLTPSPVLLCSGTARWGGQTWSMERWPGMQGHNWGRAHSPEYAWGQCVFSSELGEPVCTVEAASGRVALGGRTSPLLALMSIRRGGRVYRFDRLLDLWNRDARIDFPEWTLRMKGPAGEALLSMRARPERMVCLGYENPSGQLSHCLNSKLAAVSLRVNPVNEEAFECRSLHGGALEFLQREPVSAIPEVV